MKKLLAVVVMVFGLSGASAAGAFVGPGPIVDPPAECREECRGRFMPVTEMDMLNWGYDYCFQLFDGSYVCGNEAPAPEEPPGPEGPSCQPEPDQPCV